MLKRLQEALRKRDYHSEYYRKYHAEVEKILKEIKYANNKPEDKQTAN